MRNLKIGEASQTPVVVRLGVVAAAVIASIIGCSPGAARDRDGNDGLARQFDLKVRCLEIGRRFWEAEFRDLQKGQVAVNPRYTYAQELNTCIIYAGYISPDQQSEFLIDVLTNQELASSIRTGATVFGLSKDEFATRKKSFFPD